MATLSLPCAQLGVVFAIVKNVLSLLKLRNIFRLPYKGGQWVDFDDVIALYRGTPSVSATSLCLMRAAQPQGR